MTWAIFADDQHEQAIVELIEASSERVTAVVGGALLEYAVLRTLKERLRDDLEVTNNILAPDRALGNLGPKIDTLYLLQAIDKNTRNALKGIARVRNVFAHHLNVSFDSPDKMLVKGMNALILHEAKTHYPHHLYGGDTAQQIEPISDKRTQFIVNLKLGLIALMRDRVSHIYHSNQPLSEEEIRERFSNKHRKISQL